MSSYGVSNAMILMVLIFIFHGIIVKKTFTHQISAQPIYKQPYNSFHESFVVPEPVKDTDNMQEMIDFANSNESWSACNRQLNEDVVGVHRKTPSQCVRQEAGLTNLAVTNTYVDDTISNGAEISSGLRGYENWDSAASNTYSPLG
jgi:hypothetical protein